MGLKEDMGRIAATHNPEGIKALQGRDAQRMAEARQREQDAELGRLLRQTLGYVENGGGNSVRIRQDDATREWSVTVGTGGLQALSYYGQSLLSTLREAHAKHGDTA
jgi:hypothetical protein